MESYKNLNIKSSYISKGEENFAKAFLTPALKVTRLYQRSVGFFSSSVLLPIIDGIVELARQGGKIQLVASPKLTEQDIKAIELGYRKREEAINNAFSRDFSAELDFFDDAQLNLLVSLIEMGVLDIKIVVTDALGMYHDKLGIMTDHFGNKIVFFGSPNSSITGYQINYEKVRIFRSWMSGNEEIISNESDEFDSLWEGTNPYLTVYDYKESAKREVLNVIERRHDNSKEQATIKLRDYQEAAIKAWADNNYHGFYVMATGTGKTWTAIYSAKELLKTTNAMIVICAPYKHLIKQWAQDLEKAFKDAKIIMVSSENAGWEQQLTQAIIHQRYNSGDQIIVVSTIASFNMERFMKTIEKSTEQKLLIVDEAHRLSRRDDTLQRLFSYMLGLSATPYSGKTAKSGKELMDYFGGQVFSLPIEDALDRGFLVPYYYKPIYVNATEDEEGKYRHYTQLMMSCFRNGKVIDPENLAKYHRSRLRVISMASEKMQDIISIIQKIDVGDHFIVYCGDGRLYDAQSGEDIKHIQAIKNVLTDMGYKASQFTAQENMKERMQLINAFNEGQISTLVAIRCLDEGINIPSIKSALILSSNDNYREFVQRRGRILRTYDDKEYATIYDVIVLPSHDMTSWAATEFRRFYEYAHLALNWSSGLSEELESYIIEYGLDEDEVKAYNYEEMEDELDE